ncbi:MAG: hypothetical protein ACOCWH_03245, partial [Spirochaetota bacterium]
GEITVIIENTDTEDTYTVVSSGSGEVLSLNAAYTVVDLDSGAVVYSSADQTLHLDLAVINEDGDFIQNPAFTVAVVDENGNEVNVAVDPSTGNLVSDSPADGTYTLVVSDESGTSYTFAVSDDGQILSVVTEDTVLVLENGSVNLSDEISITVAELVVGDGDSAVWELAEQVEISAVDEAGNPVAIRVDPETGNLTADHIVEGNVTVTIRDEVGVEYTVVVEETGAVSDATQIDAAYIFNMENGSLGQSANSPVIAVYDNGEWSLADGAAVAVKDSLGNTIAGSVSFTDDGDLVFIPNDGTSVPETITVQTEDGTYTYEIFNFTELTEPTFVPSNDTGGNSSGGGIGSSDGTAVKAENGTIVVEVDENGEIIIHGEGIDISDSEVSIIVNDEDGVVLDGTVLINEDGDYVFYPEPTTPIEAGETYEVTVIVDGEEYPTETIMISVDDVSAENSKFATANGFATGDYSMTDLLNDRGEAVFGWTFDSDDNYSFMFSVQNKPAGSRVLITAYGVYDIPGHEHEVYYQRWSDTNEPVKDFDITRYSTISINPMDTAIRKDDGTYHDFAETYVEITVLDAAGNDITATCGALLEIR